MDDATADGDPATLADGGPAPPPDGDSATPPDADAEAPPEGLVTVRGAMYGVGLLWLAAMAAFGALQAAVYGSTTARPYLLVAVAAAALSVAAGYGSLRAFGLR